jgi:hypothetical protein
LGIFSSLIGIADTCPTQRLGYHGFLEVPEGVGALNAASSATFRLYAASHEPEEESLVHEHLWQTAHPCSYGAYFN